MITLPVARKRLGKHFPAAMDTHATVDKSLELVFPMRSMPGKYS
jgi:hypothetical protein